MAATVCKSPRLLCSSLAAAPCTWPLLHSDRKWRPSRLKCPAQSRPTPPAPGLTGGRCGPAPPHSYLDAVCPTENAVLGGWGRGGVDKNGAGGLQAAPLAQRRARRLPSWGRDPEALRGLCRTPITRGQFGAQLEDNLGATAPGCRFCLLRSCVRREGERLAKAEGSWGRGCGPRMKPGLAPALAQDSGQCFGCQLG